MKKILSFLLLVMFMPLSSTAQEYNGLTGMLHVPSAEPDSSGTFRGGVAFLHRKFLPNKYYGTFHTIGYYLALSPWSWIELSYACTLLRYKKYGEMVTNEDRHLNMKLLPLREGKWWPALAIGMDDICTRWGDQPDTGGSTNTFFQNIYIAACKHIDIKGYELGCHLAYRYYTSDQNRNRRGLAGGLTLRPAFYKPLRLIVEWDGAGVNAGVDVMLWRHLFLQAALVHGNGFMGCVSYHCRLPF